MIILDDFPAVLCPYYLKYGSFSVVFIIFRTIVEPRPSYFISNTIAFLDSFEALLSHKEAVAPFSSNNRKHASRTFYCHESKITPAINNITCFSFRHYITRIHQQIKISPYCRSRLPGKHLCFFRGNLSIFFNKVNN